MKKLIKRLRDYRERFIFQGGSEFANGLADALEAMQRELELYRAENSGLREAGFENGQDLLTSYLGVKAKLDAAKVRAIDYETKHDVACLTINQLQEKCDVRGKALMEQCSETKRLQQELAARDLVIQQMREDVSEGMEHVEAITCDADGNVCLPGSDDLRADKYHLQDGIDLIRKALSLQPTTEHLDAYVAERMKEVDAELTRRCGDLGALSIKYTAQAEALKLAKDALEFYVPMIRKGDSPAEEALAAINAILEK